MANASGGAATNPLAAMSALAAMRQQQQNTLAQSVPQEQKATEKRDTFQVSSSKPYFFLKRYYFSALNAQQQSTVVWRCWSTSTRHTVHEGRAPPRLLWRGTTPTRRQMVRTLPTATRRRVLATAVRCCNDIR